MTISRLRAGLVGTFAVVSLMAGAQAAQAQEACTEPVLGNLRAHGQEKELVRFKLTGLTPGSEYLVKVNGRERKSGVADAAEVTRRFRMPSFGDSNRRVKVEVIIANDTCENSPWKVGEKMTYRPAPQPEPPAVQPNPTPTPQPNPAPSPNLPSAPKPPSPPSLDSTPSPSPGTTQPAIPKAPTPGKPALPKSPSLGVQLPKDARTWATPLDPFQRADIASFSVPEKLLSRTDQPSNVANSTAALLGLIGVLMVMAAGGALAWTRFRRYDEARLTAIENPDGKLPTHLDPDAKDMAGGAAAAKRGPRLPFALPGPLARFGRQQQAAGEASPAEQPARPKRKGKKRAPLPAFDPTASGAQESAAAGAPAAAAAVAVAAKDDATKDQEQGDEPKRKRSLPLIGRLRRGEGSEEPARRERGAFKGMTEAEIAALSEEERAEMKRVAKRENKRQRLGRRKRAPLPAFDPTAPAPPPEAAEEAKPAPPGAPQRIADADRESAVKNGVPAPPAADPPAEPAKPAKPAAPSNGHVKPEPSYREQVESELQRILTDAGLNAEVEGIIADARKEAERQGVPIDSELMFKALVDDTNGAPKLSESAKGELESRFKRIVAEERGKGSGS